MPSTLGDGRRVCLDELLGHRFTVLTAVRPSPSPQAATDSLGGRTVPVADLGNEGRLGDEGRLAA
ncbi:hypothetical protein [Streptomyces pseudovenezuelae]|uniref:hypothetical protein n=1 Tax=Streptomyces pseudovenezuelae TaxID=67350 RepID=UPI002E80A41D|nr:hypothetical protein [Streptomyces pseudovenezuelae]WUA85852.1 hypothetical protein OHO81_00365 [Streptomyces pseudovenezuelae]